MDGDSSPPRDASSDEEAASPADVLQEANQGGASSRRVGRLVALPLALLLAAGVAVYAMPRIAQTSAAEQLRTAVHRLEAARSYAVTMSVGFGGKDARLSLAEVTLVHEDPDRDDIKFPYSLLQSSRAVRVGDDCWLTGVPDEAVTSGRVSCTSFGSSDAPDVPGMLTCLTMPGTVKPHNGSLEFVPRDPVAFLSALDFKTTPAPKAGATVVRVEIQLSRGDLRSVSVSVEGGPTLAVNLSLSVARVGRATVAMPTGPATLLGTRLNPAALAARIAAPGAKEAQHACRLDQPTVIDGVLQLDAPDHSKEAIRMAQRAMAKSSQWAQLVYAMTLLDASEEPSDNPDILLDPQENEAAMRTVREFCEPLLTL